MEPIDVLAVVAHPDDAELICGGSLLVSKVRGEYGEPFWTRETVQVPSLGAVPVSTF